MLELLWSPDAGLLHGVAHYSTQMGGIGPDTAAETDVDRRLARSQEALKVGIQRFRVRSPLAQPEPCSECVRRPILRCRYQAWAVAVEGFRRRRWVATWREAETRAPPVANQPRIGPGQHADEAVARTVERRAKVVPDNARQRKLTGRRQHRDGQRPYVRDTQFLGKVGSRQRLLVSDDDVGLGGLCNRPAVLQHALDHWKDLAAKRGPLPLRRWDKRLEIGTNRPELDRGARSEPLKPCICCERDGVTALAEQLR